jgi:hypothetical protein
MNKDKFPCDKCHKIIDDSEENKNKSSTILLIYHTPVIGTERASLFCSPKCNFASPLIKGCVICNKYCPNERWFVIITASDGSFWTLVKAACSTICYNLVINKEGRKNPTCKQCQNCKKLLFTNIKQCGRCKITYYCDQGCQKQDWQAHKKMCLNS